jgi:hypothetical protein
MARKPENRTTFLSRVDILTPSKIKAIAESLGYVYAGKGSQGQLLDAIASGDVVLYKSSGDKKSARLEGASD